MSLECCIRDAIRSRPMFDIKYRVFTPLLGLVRPIAEIASQDDPAFWAPLGVLLGEQHGFAVQLSRLASSQSFSRDWRQELYDDLCGRTDEQREEAVWWRQRYNLFDDSNAIKTLVNRFADLLGDDAGPLNRFTTLERWLRFVLDDGTSTKPWSRNQTGQSESLTMPLCKLFGGETRYEFGARGGWYDAQGNYIPDVPLIFEFSAKVGVVGREAIREIIVRYLRDKGGEDVVLVEEAAISGYFQD